MTTTAKHNSDPQDKHILTTNDIRKDIEQQADNYANPLLIYLVITAAVFLFGLVIAFRFRIIWLRVVLILAVLGGTGYFGMAALRLKTAIDKIKSAAGNAGIGNISIMEDRIVDKWRYTDKIGFIEQDAYCIATSMYRNGLDVPILVFKHAEKGDKVYLVRTPDIDGISYAYLDKDVILDNKNSEHLVKLETNQ